MGVKDKRGSAENQGGIFLNGKISCGLGVDFRTVCAKIPHELDSAGLFVPIFITNHKGG
jgi:hypothetical protein